MIRMISAAQGGHVCGVQSIDCERRGGGRRAEITSFSRASRRRMLLTLNSVNISKYPDLPLFLTLTYPANYPTDPAVYKRHLDNFFKRFSRRYPYSAAIWRLEFQRRGAPHYHMLIFVDHRDYHNNMQQSLELWAVDAWREVINTNCAMHKIYGVDVAQLNDYKAVVSYCSKYMAKPADSPDDNDYALAVGRYWGVHNREYLIIDMVRVVISDDEFYRLRRLLRRYQHARQAYVPVCYGKAQGVSIFAPEAFVCRFIDYYILDHRGSPGFCDWIRSIEHPVNWII